MSRNGRRSIVALTAASVSLAGLVIAAPVALAHVARITIGCTSVDYNFTEFPDKTNTIQETVSIDGSQVASQTFTFTGHTGSNSIAIDVGPGTHTVTATASWGTKGYKAKTVTLQGCMPPCPSNTISSNFNGTAIPGGDYIWFNSVFKPSGVSSSGGTVLLTNSSITFSANGVDYTLAVPDAQITFSPSATAGTTTFSGGEWTTTVPLGFSDNVFFSGLAFPVPSAGLPGGINPVTWRADITLTSISSVQWQWGAAVYTTFSTAYNSLGVKPLHSTSLDSYNNGDQAGTPENFKSYTTGGARGGGAANATGSYSPTGGCTAA
jgi:hypothetical protein